MIFSEPCLLLLNAAAAASCCARVKTQRWCSRQQLIVENFVRNKSLLCFVLFSCFFSELCSTNVIVLSFIEICKVRHHLFNHSWNPDTDVILFFSVNTLIFETHLKRFLSGFLRQTFVLNSITSISILNLYVHWNS